MKLSTYCMRCKKEIRFSAMARDRLKLAAKMGHNIELKCKSCGEISKYHVNKIHAVPNRIAAIFSLVIFIGGTVLCVICLSKYLSEFASVYVIYNIIFIFSIPGMIYFTIKSAQESKCRAFNAHRI